MSESIEEVGQLIRSIRKTKGLTQKELGEKLGVAEATVNGYETGRQNLTIKTLHKIAQALNVSLRVLLE